MTGLEIMLIMAAVQAAAGGAKAIHDNAKAKKAEEAAGERPEYQVPDSIKKYVEMAEKASQTRSQLPGYGIRKNEINAGAARAAGQISQNAESSVGAITGLLGAQGMADRSLAQLQTMAAEYQERERIRRQSALSQAYNTRAQYENEQWRQNDLLPWEIKMNEANAYRAAARRGLDNTIDTVGSAVTSGVSAGSQMGTYDDMMPNFTSNMKASQGGNVDVSGYSGPESWMPEPYTSPSEMSQNDYDEMMSRFYK